MTLTPANRALALRQRLPVQLGHRAAPSERLDLAALNLGTISSIGNGSLAMRDAFHPITTGLATGIPLTAHKLGHIQSLGLGQFTSGLLQQTTTFSNYLGDNSNSFGKFARDIINNCLTFLFFDAQQIISRLSQHLPEISAIISLGLVYLGPAIIKHAAAFPMAFFMPRVLQSTQGHDIEFDRVLEDKATVSLYLGTDVRSGKRVVVKVFDRHFSVVSLGTIMLRMCLENNRRALKLFQDYTDAPFSYKILDIKAEGNQVYIVMDYVDELVVESTRLTDLFDLIENPQILTPKWLAKTFSQIATQLRWLLSHGYVYADLKPDNIMLTPHGAAIIDFDALVADGDQRRYPLLSNYPIGSRFYEAPEVTSGATWPTEVSMVFSFGTILLETIPPWQEEFRDIREFAQRCVEPEPQNRPKLGKVIDELEAMK